MDFHLKTITDSAETALSVAKELSVDNLAAVFRIICVLPVTSNEAERSFSQLKLIKTHLRSTMLSDW